MVSEGQVILIGVLGVTILLVFFAVMLRYSLPKRQRRIQKTLIHNDDIEGSDQKELEKNIQDRYKNLKDYYLTYLECCYGAFITIFIGIMAIPVIPLPNLVLKVVSVFCFWFVGGYYLAQIIYTYGQLKVVYGYLDIDDTISHEVEELGFPFNILERVFGFARKNLYGRANIKYFGVGIGYLGLLGISLIACI